MTLAPHSPSRPRALRNLCAAGAVLGSSFLTACGGAPAAPEPSAAENAFATLIEFAIADAHELGVAPEQISLLQDAQAEGALTYPTYLEASRLMTQCFDDIGVSYSLTPEGPLDVLTLDVWAEEPLLLDLSSDCIIRYFDSVSFVYTTQPTAVEAIDADIEAKRAPLLDCIRMHGISIDDDSTVDEIKSALIRLFTGIDPDDATGEVPPGYVPVDCAGPLGIAGW